MQAYTDITLLPCDDVGHHFLWEKLYQQIHLALVENKTTNESSLFGVTFPEFNTSRNQLGRKLRVFAPSHAALETLNLPRWLDNLSDYLHITSIRDVPVDVKRAVSYRRIQTKSSPERLARRTAKRRGISYERALAEYSTTEPEWSRNPFLWINSLSSDKRFKLFIAEEVKAPLEEMGLEFTLYGLGQSGKTAFLPQF